MPATKPNVTTLLPRADGPAKASLLEHFKSRESEELVVGLTGPIGAGVSQTASKLKAQLESSFGYKAHIIKVSELIAKASEYAAPESETAAKFDTLQSLGNKLRKEHGSSFLMELCVQEIGLKREYNEDAGQLEPKSQRTAYIIDSIKNPAEIELLRAVYREHFWAVAILANESKRRERLKIKGFNTAEDIEAVLTRDANEAFGHGQKVRDSVHRADYFLHNDSEKIDDLIKKVKALLSRVFNTNIAALSADEIGMAHAHSAATRSACISRQVGAAVVSEQGEVLGVGWNDVPKFGGGLYGDLFPAQDSTLDVRCFKMEGSICHNDKQKEYLYDQIVKELKELLPALDQSSVRTALAKTDMRNIIEYSRAVHAEMEAILAAGRTGRSVVGSKLYTTTYPCHNCARHVVAAGIKEVVYIEPYPKSMALPLHSDSVTEDVSERGTHVFFRPYEGVSPRSANRIYPAGEERKVDGKWNKLGPGEAKPLFRPALDSFIEREQLVVAKLKDAGDSDGTQNEAG